MCGGVQYDLLWVWFCTVCGLDFNIKVRITLQNMQCKILCNSLKPQIKQNRVLCYSLKDI